MLLVSSFVDSLGVKVREAREGAVVEEAVDEAVICLASVHQGPTEHKGVSGASANLGAQGGT